MLTDTVNAFTGIFTVEGNPEGPLSGLTFAAKDLFDVAGHVTGGGNPDWARTHDKAEATAPCVQALLDAGAGLAGKTHTDELAYSLMGVNAHYGTPVNSAAPDRVPGGSSSGSVAAVAAGLVDIGLGSDTGGSVRAPASFCGVYGIRTSHGRISLSGVMPLAPRFDTCGWFAKDPEIFTRTGLAYGIDAGLAMVPARLMIAEDAFALAGAETQTALQPMLDRIKQRFSQVMNIALAANGFEAVRKTFMTCQAAEVWQAHGDWVTATQPNFGPGVKQRFEMACAVCKADLLSAMEAGAKIADRLHDLLGTDGIIALPTVPGPAPLRSDDESSLNDFRLAALKLLANAGLAGLPQISIPAGTVNGAPVGLSLIAPKGQDETLLAMCK